MSPVAETSVNRMTEVPAFQVPADPEAVDSYWRALEQGKRPSPEILERLADPIVVTAVNDVIGTSFTVEVAPADYGRGASGYAAALQIVEAIGGVGGATATLYHGAKDHCRSVPSGATTARPSASRLARSSGASGDCIPL